MFGLTNLRTTPVTERIATLGDRFSHREMATIERFGTVLNIDAGSVFVQQGEFGHEALIILDGTAAVCRDGESVADVGPGDIVGEGALLGGIRRNASLIATTDVAAVVFNPREFKAVLDACPRLDLRANLLATRRSRDLVES